MQPWREQQKKDLWQMIKLDRANVCVCTLASWKNNLEIQIA